MGSGLKATAIEERLRVAEDAVVEAVLHLSIEVEAVICPDGAVAQLAEQNQLTLAAIQRVVREIAFCHNLPYSFPGYSLEADAPDRLSPFHRAVGVEDLLPILRRATELIPPDESDAEACSAWESSRTDIHRIAEYLCTKRYVGEWTRLIAEALDGIPSAPTDPPK